MEQEQEQGGGEPVDVHAEAGEGRAAGGANHAGPARDAEARTGRDQHAGRKEGGVHGGRQGTRQSECRACGRSRKGCKVNKASKGG